MNRHIKDDEGRKRRITRQNSAFWLAASALGLWLGISAPGTSPVSPAVAAPATFVNVAENAPAPVLSDPRLSDPGPGGPFHIHGGRR